MFISPIVDNICGDYKEARMAAQFIIHVRSAQSDVAGTAAE